MTEEKCSNCRFWEFFDSPDDAEGDDSMDVGKCKRHPPVFVGLDPNSIFEDSRDLPCECIGAASWSQPTTSRIDWCGEWQLVRIPKREACSKLAPTGAFCLLERHEPDHQCPIDRRRDPSA